MHRPSIARRLRGRDRSRGQSLVELALIAPVLLLLMLAAIDLGRIFYSQITITNSAREGAFEASLNPASFSQSACSASNRVMCAVTSEAKNSFVTVSPADVTRTCTPDCAATYGKRVTVTVTGHFQLLTPLIASFTGGQNITLVSAATADIIVTPGGSGVATPSPTPTPTPTPAPTPTPTGTPTPTATPVPTPTPTPCALPTAGFTYVVTGTPTGRNLSFTSISTPTTGDCAITYWRWDWGDDSTSAGDLATTTHIFPKRNQTYNVTLTVTNSGGSASVVQTVATQ